MRTRGDAALKAVKKRIVHMEDVDKVQKTLERAYAILFEMVNEQDVPSDTLRKTKDLVIQARGTLDAYRGYLSREHKRLSAEETEDKLC